MKNFTIEILNQKKIKYKKKTSLLKILEYNNIKIEYQCRSGYCGTCRIQILKGNISYSIKKPIAALFKRKEIFPCCCEPEGNIIIKI
ncbi:Uncharacterized ferredoxin-like protein YfaE [Buchnera aphidicola (Hyalopterus amygdali)]